jgi:hypothetical protein
MRLPWLQVEQDGLTKCRLLARLLGVPETQGIGIGMSAWQWALELAPDGDFSGTIPGPEMLAAATGWPVSDAARLVSEMQRVGMLATAPVMRIRGLDRYRRAWEKNQRKSSKPADSGSRVPETGANPAPTRAVSARQTQTQTQNPLTALSDKSDVAPKRSRKPGVELTQDELDVFEHWKAVMDKPKSVATSERKRLIAKWLPDYGVERLQAAIDGCARTPHNMGQNDRHQKYNSIELILRDAGRIERFEDAARRGAA